MFNQLEKIKKSNILLSPKEYNVLHLTSFDLNYGSQKKPFDKITINDFNYSLTEAIKAKIIFFIDVRQKYVWWKNFFGFSDNLNSKVKQLSF